MTELLTTLTSEAGTVATNVGLGAAAGVSVGLAVYGIKRVWRAFKSM